MEQIRDLLAIIIIMLPVWLAIWFWNLGDIENKSSLVVKDPKTGGVVSRFKDWLEGKEEDGTDMHKTG